MVHHLSADGVREVGFAQAFMRNIQNLARLHILGVFLAL